MEITRIFKLIMKYKPCWEERFGMPEEKMGRSIVSAADIST
jgi:hypothetical protein